MAVPRKARSGAPPLALAAQQGITLVCVGPELRAFHIHRSLLVHHSEYFAKALNGPWKEAEEGAVTLDDVEPEICLRLGLKIVVGFIYSTATVNFVDLINQERIFHTQTGQATMNYAIQNLPFNSIVLQKMIDEFANEYASDCHDSDEHPIGELSWTFAKRVMNELRRYSYEDMMKRCYIEYESDGGREKCRGKHMFLIEETGYAEFRK